MISAQAKGEEIVVVVLRFLHRIQSILLRSRVMTHISMLELSGQATTHFT